MDKLAMVKIRFCIGTPEGKTLREFNHQELAFPVANIDKAQVLQLQLHNIIQEVVKTAETLNR